MALFVFGIQIGVRRNVVMIDSIRWDDDFGVSKRVDRTGPPADEEASNNFYDNECLLEATQYILGVLNFIIYFSRLNKVI